MTVEERGESIDGFERHFNTKFRQLGPVRMPNMEQGESVQVG
jgi:hypothetical protein